MLFSAPIQLQMLQILLTFNSVLSERAANIYTCKAFPLSCLGTLGAYQSFLSKESSEGCAKVYKSMQLQNCRGARRVSSLAWSVLLKGGGGPKLAEGSQGTGWEYPATGCCITQQVSNTKEKGQYQNPSWACRRFSSWCETNLHGPSEFFLAKCWSIPSARLQSQASLVNSQVESNEC